MGLGITLPQSSVTICNFTEPNVEFENYLYNSNSPSAQQQSSAGSPSSSATTVLPGNVSSAPGSVTTTTTTSSAAETPDTTIKLTVNDESTTTAKANAQTIQTTQVIKSLIYFLSLESSQPMWNYEDITAKGNFIVLFLPHSKFFTMKIIYVLSFSGFCFSFFVSSFFICSLDNKISRSIDMLFTLYCSRLFG